MISSSSGDYSSYSTIPTLLAEERVILFVGYFETSPIERRDSSGGLLALSCCRQISSAGAVEASGLFFRVNTSRPAKRRRPQLRPPPPDSDASSLPAIFCIIEASGVVSRPASLSVLLVCCLLRGALFTLSADCKTQQLIPWQFLHDLMTSSRSSAIPLILFQYRSGELTPSSCT